MGEIRRTCEVSKPLKRRDDANQPSVRLDQVALRARHEYAFLQSKPFHRPHRTRNLARLVVRRQFPRHLYSRECAASVFAHEIAFRLIASDKIRQATTLCTQLEIDQILKLMSEIRPFDGFKRRHESRIAGVDLFRREQRGLGGIRELWKAFNKIRLFQEVEILQDCRGRVYVNGILQSTWRNAAADMPQQKRRKRTYRLGIPQPIANDDVPIENVVEQFDQDLLSARFDIGGKTAD